MLIDQPGTGALAVIWTIAWYAAFFGCMLIGLSFKLKKLKRINNHLRTYNHEFSWELPTCLLDRPKQSNRRSIRCLSNVAYWPSADITVGPPDVCFRG